MFEEKLKPCCLTYNYNWQPCSVLYVTKMLKTQITMHADFTEWHKFYHNAIQY